jgi:hypothetical protein
VTLNDVKLHLHHRIDIINVTLGAAQPHETVRIASLEARRDAYQVALDMLNNVEDQ